MKNIVITKNDLIKLTKLARIDIENDSISDYLNQLNEIVNYMSILDNVDLTKVKPLYHVLDKTISGRVDTAHKSTDINILLENTSEKTDSFFKVPKVINRRKKSK
tara:strand:+ start:1383 stop:1697 length:315 start_codon:yes stop_codon:yes gene_type:complete